MMSAFPSIDAYDAQMLDFSSDPDVPMNITGSVEFFAEALMDHDDHLAASAHSEHASIEVDMEEYAGDNAEYEMADETTEYHRPRGDEPLDIEVYDASHAPSPLVPLQPLQPSTDIPIGSEHPTSTTPTLSEYVALPESQSEPQSEVPLAAPDHPAADVSHVGPSASEDSLDAVASELTRSSDIPDERPSTSESHGQLPEAPASADAEDEEKPHIPLVADEHVGDSEAVQHEHLEPPTTDSGPLHEDAHDASVPVQNENATYQPPAVEEETADTLFISEGVYIDPPPAVLLSVDNPSEPGFALFSLPSTEGEDTEVSSGNQKAYSLLFESRPTLYYEPLSSVFETLRQDEGLLSRVSHSFEGELVLDAYDLELAIPEDNVHSREISLHDLNILHDGSDFVGPLRLLLRAVVPRFIIRYYALQEQIQRLHVAAEGREGQDEEHHEHYDTVEILSQQEAASHPPQTELVAANSEVPPTAETEEHVQEVEEAPQVNYETEDKSTVGEPSTEYREVVAEVTHTLEDQNDYEGTNVDGEYESTESDVLDADQVHDPVTDNADASAAISGHGLGFGGEPEYLDYAQPEEYDERYGEELPERAGGASPVQDDEPPHYEEGQDTPTTVDVTQIISPGEEEEEESVATPIPRRAVLEPEPSESTNVSTTGYNSVSTEQKNSAPSDGEFTTNENSVDAAQVPGNQEPSTAQTRISPKLGESDSNFVSALERETDGFEQSLDVNTEHNGQGSIEPNPQHDEAWDEWDDEDAEGDNEEDWIDPDADSNESSITLSSKGSSKRSFDEVDPNEEPPAENLQDSPGSKRPRVQ